MKLTARESAKIYAERKMKVSKTLTLKDGRVVDRDKYVTAKTLDLKKSISKTIEEENVSDALIRMEEGIVKGLTMVDIFVRGDFK